MVDHVTRTQFIQASPPPRCMQAGCRYSPRECAFDQVKIIIIIITIQGLASLGIHPSPDEIELLLRKYDDDGDGNVNYLSFCRDVDCLETFSSRSKAPTEHHVTLHGGFRSDAAPHARVRRPAACARVCR